MNSNWNVENIRVSLYEDNGIQKISIGNTQYNLADLKKVTINEKDEAGNYLEMYEIPINQKKYYLYLEDGQYYLLFNGKDVNTNKLIISSSKSPKWIWPIYVIQFISFLISVEMVRYLLDYNGRGKASVLFLFATFYTTNNIAKKRNINVSVKLIKIFLSSILYIILAAIITFLYSI